MELAIVWVIVERQDLAAMITSFCARLYGLRRANNASRFIVDFLVNQQIGTLVIGKNAQWKQKVNLGKRNNQNFVTIPHSEFIEMLTYKCKLAGIQVLLIEESYTSKSSFLDGDPIPTYGETRTVPFSGYRNCRGLYKATQNRLINADVNGSYNILRKAIPNAFAQGIGSFCSSSLARITPLKVKAKGICAIESMSVRI